MRKKLFLNTSIVSFVLTCELLVPLNRYSCKVSILFNACMGHTRTENRKMHQIWLEIIICLLHLPLLSLLLGDVLLHAVVQDTLHPKVPHSVDDRSNPDCILQNMIWHSVLHILVRIPLLQQTGHRKFVSSEDQTASCPALSAQTSSAEMLN